MKHRYIIFFLIVAIIVALLLMMIPKAQPVINVEDTIILIDPGHGGFDSGAIGRYTKVHEDDLNLAVSLKLRKLFEDNGYKVVMTRDDENAVGVTKDGDMWKRRNIIDNSNADIVICVHMNKFSDSSVHGPITFYFEKSIEGEKLAKSVQDELNAALKPYRPRTYKPERYYILRSGQCPCILVECGFISNEREERLLQTDDYQAKCAYAIYQGATLYLANRFVTDINEDIEQ